MSEKKLKISLCHRHCGLYSFCYEIILSIDPDQIIKDVSTAREEDYEINEDKLLEILPKNFLPCLPKKCLITVDNDSWGTGIRNLKIFRNFSKYFDSYSIGLYPIVEKTERENSPSEYSSKQGQDTLTQ